MLYFYSLKTSKTAEDQKEFGAELRKKHKEIVKIAAFSDNIDPFKALSQRNSVSILRNGSTKDFLEKLADVNKDIALKTFYNGNTMKKGKLITN